MNSPLNRLQTYTRRTQSQRSVYAARRKSLRTIWACEELNLGPHAYQASLVESSECASSYDARPETAHATFAANPEAGPNSLSARTHGVHTNAPELVS